MSSLDPVILNAINNLNVGGGGSNSVPLGTNVKLSSEEHLVTLGDEVYLKAGNYVDGASYPDYPDSLRTPVPQTWSVVSSVGTFNTNYSFGFAYGKGVMVMAAQGVRWSDDLGVTWNSTSAPTTLTGVVYSDRYEIFLAYSTSNDTFKTTIYHSVDGKNWIASTAGGDVPSALSITSVDVIQDGTIVIRGSAANAYLTTDGNSFKRISVAAKSPTFYTMPSVASTTFGSLYFTDGTESSTRNNYSLATSKDSGNTVGISETGTSGPNRLAVVSVKDMLIGVHKSGFEISKPDPYALTLQGIAINTSTVNGLQFVQKTYQAVYAGCNAAESVILLPESRTLLPFTRPSVGSSKKMLLLDGKAYCYDASNFLVSEDNIIVASGGEGEYTRIK